MPTSPPYWCSGEDSSASSVPTARSPSASSRVSTTTIDEWPSENQKPTDSGRRPSAISLRVVLSMAAMWSASNACRAPSVYAVIPVPRPNRPVPTR